MSFWACAQLETHHERYALHCLGVAGFEVYQPRIRRVGARKSNGTAALFPGYAFILVELQWHAAYWSPGVSRLILNGERPARVPDRVISELRARERNGLVVLPRKPAVGSFALGDKLRVKAGPFTGLDGIYAGMAPRERVMVLLSMLGGQARVELPARDVARA
jgi:transcriptional antiterminator RfaH